MNLPLPPFSPYTLLDSGILIVEPDAAIRHARSLLLAAAADRICGGNGLPNHGVRLAILSHSIGVEVLRSVAHDIRVQSPHARILILGSIQLTLEDHLYDAAISDDPSSKELLGALRLLGDSHPPQHTDWNAAKGATGALKAGGALPRHRTPRESDPRKVVEALLPGHAAAESGPRGFSRRRRGC